jgi:MtrB/PioB family decaheme-associated outer membrane protein
MNRPCKIRQSLAALLALLAGGASAQDAAPTPPAIALDAAGGARFTDVSGSDEKFEEYGEVDQGAVLDHLRFRLQYPTSADHLEIDIRDALQDDESYRLVAGRRGRYELSLSYDATPHVFSGGAFLWGGFGSGRLQIADVVQSQLEANEQTGPERSGGTLNLATDPNADTTGEDAVQQGIVRGLYSAARPVTFKVQRQRAGAGLEYQVARDVRVWVRVANENRDGARVITAGTYERWNVGSGLTHTIDRFLTAGADLAEPIDYRTLTVTAGAGVQKKAWLADVEYTLTRFRNFEGALLWDNPFRIGDAIQAGGVDRGRFAVGQLALPPDSLAHDVSASGAVDLPLHGRLAATLSFGLIGQVDAFLPYTQNAAILATNVGGTPSAATLARPAGNLDGDVRTIAGTVSLSARPLEPVSVTVKYRYYGHDGKSRELTFPGYAAFGESAWRTVKNDRNAPVANEVFDYRRQDADLGVDYRLSRLVTLSLEGAWEGWSFDNLRLDGLDEYAVGGGFTVRPLRTATLKVRYRFSDRSADGYLQGRTAENPEATGLVNFNWADRRRHQASARFQMSPVELVSFGVLGKFLDEEYDGKTEGGRQVDQFRFGRTDLRALMGAVDVTVTPGERLTFQASYSREYRKEQMASAAKDDGVKANASFGFDDDYAPENYWDSNIAETVDTVGVGATVQLVPEKLVLDASYNLSFSSMDVDTRNPNGVSATTLANAVANDWPEIRNRLHEVVVALTYPLLPHVRAGVRYQFESFDLDDFAWSGLQPYMAGSTVENSTRFLFAGATYDHYKAHVGAAYLSGSF